MCRFWKRQRDWRSVYLKQCTVAEIVCEVQIAHVSSVKALRRIGRESFVVTAVSDCEF